MARSCGAVGLIASIDHRRDPALADANVIFAENTLELAIQIVLTVRELRGHRRITAITGSAGKTSVAAMLTHALKSIDETPVLSSNANRNLWFHILGFESRAHRNRHTVIEVASSALREFKKWDFTVSPDVAILTNISAAHLSYMQTLENVARTKSELFRLPPPGGTAVINADTEFADELSKRAMREGCQVVTYGENENATIRLVAYDLESGSVNARIGEETLEYRVGARGKHMAINSLAVIAALRSYRISDWRLALESLDSFEPVRGRGATSQITLDDGISIHVIDETYNANPASIKAAIDTLAATNNKHGGRKVAVIGDILELGASSQEIHESLASLFLQNGLDRILLFGSEMQHLYAQIGPNNEHISHWHDLSDLEQELRFQLRHNDLVLFKASGSTGLKELLKRLTDDG